jgi:hypothetical protein
MNNVNDSEIVEWLERIRVITNVFIVLKLKHIGNYWNVSSTT